MKMKLQFFGENEDAVIETLKEVSEDYENMSSRDAIRVAEISQLNRIAGALEGINEELSSISSSLAELSGLADLADCVTITRDGEQFCITGNVTNYD